MPEKIIFMYGFNVLENNEFAYQCIFNFFELNHPKV